MRKIKIGIVGAGRITSWFLNDLQHAKHREQIVVSAVWNRTFSRAQQLAKKYAIKQVCSSFEELLASDTDAFYIGTNHESHYQFAKAILQRKKPVYCEKPITLDYQQACELYKLARNKQVLFLDGIKTGVIPAFQALIADLKTKIIGEVRYVFAPMMKISTSGNIPDPQPGEDPGGVLWGAGVYPLYLTHSVLGNPERITFLKQDYPHNPGSVQNAYLTIKYSHNKVGYVPLTNALNNSQQAEICGTKGYVKLGGNLRKYHANYRSDSPHCPYTYQVFNNHNQLLKKTDLPFDTEGEGLRYLIDHFYELVVGNKLTSPVIKPDLSLNIIKTLQAVNNNSGSESVTLS